MKSQLTRSEDSTITLKITVPWSEVKKTQEEVLAEMAKNADLPGFRKGKAPKKIVEENLDKTRVREEVLRHVLPKAYIDTVKEHNLKPIIDPKVHVKPLEDEKDWEFEAVTCEEPKVDLGDYKTKVKSVTAKSKIIVPGKESEGPKLDDVIKTLLEAVSVKLPKILVDYETDKLLSQTLDEIKKLGLTLDQYLASTRKNAEMLRLEYEGKALNDLKLEFALRKVAEAEKITVGDGDLQKTIDKAKTEEEKKNLTNNKYLLASILRQQKTLDFLRNL
ncbi:MAG: Trigger factor [Candidatus Levybacteria bacterium GW2011_GWA2_40_8]|nr:MAG: Trigger factor [Candidatus Levybacteria bacterium GW2011_GWA2_40_8]